MRPLSPLLALALPLTTVVPAAAVPGSTDHRPTPVTTQQREDNVPMLESFDSLGKRLQPRVNDPGIQGGTVGFTHRPPNRWSVSTDDSMAGTGVEE